MAKDHPGKQCSGEKYRTCQRWIHWLTHGAGQGRDRGWRQLERIIARAMPGHCVFCRSAIRTEVPWCEACFASLAHHMHGCPRCAEPLPPVWHGERHEKGYEGLCGQCLARPPAFDRSWAPWLYRDDIARLLQRFKFHGDRRAGHVLLALLDQGLEQVGFEIESRVLIPVPLHSVRARRRGFDQTEWLARGLAGRRAWQVERAVRARDTPTQRGLRRRQRQHNLRDAFSVPTRLPDTVMIFDDVMTTGATFEALAWACRRAGARRVIALALVRTPPGRQ